MSTSEWIQLKYNYYIAHQGMTHADRAMIKIILLLWQTYFKNLDLPKERTKEWLHGINAKALFKTRKSIMSKSHLSLNELPAINSIPKLVLYGTDDIYQSTKWITRERYPYAQYIELENSGHFPWLQDKVNFRLILSQFYEI
jgi:pimeloyl-ACP methyl ester carboxylesterase